MYFLTDVSELRIWNGVISPIPFLSSDTSDVGNENGNAIESSQRDGNGIENGVGERENIHRHRNKEMTPG
ncbi:hypothetical protein Goshw_026194 [Gossypium schwendimanii]|uniref:Uncharacterized protein n=1 Tax=Gossypium schwendimanii TaxID=34291 RepID=A0A7J9L609_GOSSC|nr:hypothetical protein [Gossypium schwendimanii]